MTAKKAPGALLPDPLPIEPVRRPFDLAITPPGSKSLTCRAYVLAALAEGESLIIRPLRSDDTDALVGALSTLGAASRWDGPDVRIRGVGGRFPRGGEINLGDGGAPTRFMIAAACLAAAPVTVDGSARMRQRPIAEGVDLLRRLGASIQYLEADGRLPVRVTPSESFTGGAVDVGRTLSSQFVSAILLVAPFLKNGVAIDFIGEPTSGSYVDLTLRTLAGWDVHGRNRRPSIPRQAVKARRYPIEPDASSAVYWMVAATICPGSKVRVQHLSARSAQPDLQALGVLEGMGARVQEDDGVSIAGPAGPPRAADCDARHMPDAAVALAAAAATAEGTSVLRGLHTLRVKETDRIAALAAELRKIGCTVDSTGDSIAIDPSTCHERPVVIDTWNDHRMAMAFGILGLARPGISIRDPACVSKSYPGFWSDLGRVYDEGSV